MSSSSCNSELSNRGHEKFVELCALYSGGQMSEAEQVEFHRHLAICKECQTLLVDYRHLIQDVLPLLVDGARLEDTAGFDCELAETKTRVFAALTQSEGRRNGKAPSESHSVWTDRLLSAPAMRYAALVFLIAILSIAGYLLGLRQSARTAPMAPTHSEIPGLQAQLSDAIGQRDSLQKMMEQRDQELRKVSADMNRQAGQVAKLQQLLDEAATSRSNTAASIAGLIDENASLKTGHEGISRRLDETQSNLLNAKQRLDQLEAERVGLQVESATRQRQVEEFTAQIAEQQRLLAADRDIRELMGARNLLLADLFDIDTNGRNKKPFGRIFYTKNKSLVFYAFDLDKQTLLRNAKTFQAWGARATSHGNENPVNLGIFYMDNATARRWVLKLDDPKTLERIDSVFVTVEPEGGSSKPSSRQLLFTYLRGEANHP